MSFMVKSLWIKESMRGWVRTMEDRTIENLRSRVIQVLHYHVVTVPSSRENDAVWRGVIIGGKEYNA